MTIAVVKRGTSLHSTANTSPYTMVDGSHPAPGKLLHAVLTRRGAATDPTSLTAYGLTFTKVGAFGWAGGANKSFWAADSTGAVDGDPSVAVPGTTTGCHVKMYEVSGVPISLGVLACYRDQGSGIYIVSGNSTATSATLSLAALLKPANRLFSSFEHVTQEVTTPRNTGGDTWTELDDDNFGTPGSADEDQWLDAVAVAATASASWATSSVWGGLSCEFVALKGGNLALTGVG